MPSAGEGAAPFPQVRIVALTARAGRAMLGAICGRARAWEQTLLARLVRRHPDLVAGRVICFDRNVPGCDLITAILHAGQSAHGVGSASCSGVTVSRMLPVAAHARVSTSTRI